MEQMNDGNIKIKVYGLGGGGGNAVENMIREKIANVDFAIANTDQQAINNSKCKEKILLGVNSSKGLGAGANPDVGRKACLESKEEIANSMRGYDMVFLAAGMGGGTGTAATSCFAQIAKELNILCIAIVTKPFKFEGRKRERQAEAGLEELLKTADSTVIVSNNNLMALNGKMPLNKSFQIADKTLMGGVRTITDLVNGMALINLDFADISSTLKGMGHAVLGIAGSTASEHKAAVAAAEAVQPELLEYSIKGAKQAIINITGGTSITLEDAEEAVEVIRQKAHTDIDTIFGIAIDEKFGEGVIVSVIATDFDNIETNKVKKEVKTLVRPKAEPVKIEVPIVKEPAISLMRPSTNATAIDEIISAKENNQEPFVIEEEVEEENAFGFFSKRFFTEDKSHSTVKTHRKAFID